MLTWVHCVAFTTEESHEATKQYLSKHSQPYWVDILLEHLNDTPKDFEDFRLSIDEFLGLVLRRHPAQIFKIAPLLFDDSTLYDGIMVLNYIETEAALPMLVSLFERAPNFQEQEIVNLLDAVQSIGGEKAHQAFDKLCEILSPRIQNSPILQRTVNDAFDWEEIRGKLAASELEK